MTSGRGSNIAASIRQRLLNQARASGRPFNEILQYFAMERFLYRLSQSTHADKFVLKGALTLITWRAPVSRPTMDIDLLGITANDIDAMVAVTQAICQQEVTPDGLVFDPDSVQGERIVEDADYAGVRIKFHGRLDTARIAMQLDIGFGDIVVPGSMAAEYPAIINLPAPRLNVYSRESAIAEKLEAMIKLGEINSRIKDFFDIWLLSRHYDFDGGMLAKAVNATFEARGTEIPSLPLAFTTDFAAVSTRQTQWRGFLRRNRLESVPTDFTNIVRSIAGFLGPVINTLATKRAFPGIWKAPGPWQ